VDLASIVSRSQLSQLHVKWLEPLNALQDPIDTDDVDRDGIARHVVAALRITLCKFWDYGIHMPAGTVVLLALLAAAWPQLAMTKDMRELNQLLDKAHRSPADSRASFDRAHRQLFATPDNLAGPTMLALGDGSTAQSPWKARSIPTWRRVSPGSDTKPTWMLFALIMLAPFVAIVLSAKS
jgi:hypothetical protein